VKLLYSYAAKTARRLIFNRIVRTSLYVALYWCILALPVILLKQFRILPFNTVILPVLLVVLLPANAVYQVIGKKDARSFLAILDNTAGLKARLISAWDQMEKGWTSPYAELIRQDVRDSVPRLDFRKLFPLKLPRFSVALPFLFIITVSLLVFQIPVYWFRNIDPAVAGRASGLDAMARKLIQENRENPDPGNKRLAEEMERLAAEFRDLPMTKTEAMEKLQALARKMDDAAKNARREQLRNSETAPDILKETEEALDMMDQNMLDQKDINDLERRLMESPDINPETQEALKNKFDDFKKKPDPQAQQDLADDIRDQLQDTDGTNDNGRALDQGRRQLEEMSQAIGEPPSASSGEIPESEADGNAPGGREGDDSSNRSGQNKTPGTKDSADAETDFETDHPDTVLQGPGPEDRISNNSTVQNQIKSIPKISKKEVTTEDIDTKYKKAIENNILKEEIPLSMREYIKDYFIGIGILNDEEPGDD
jgi:hypothetical protein